MNENKTSIQVYDPPPAYFGFDGVKIRPSPYFEFGNWQIAQHFLIIRNNFQYVSSYNSEFKFISYNVRLHFSRLRGSYMDKIFTYANFILVNCLYVEKSLLIGNKYKTPILCCGPSENKIPSSIRPTPTTLAWKNKNKHMGLYSVVSKLHTSFISIIRIETMFKNCVLSKPFDKRGREFKFTAS